MCGFGMSGFASLDVVIELRGFPAIEAAVIAHHANLAVSKLFDTVDFLWHPCVRRLGVLPRQYQRHLAGIVDAGPNVVLDNGAVVQVEPEMRRQQIGLFGERRTLYGYDLGEGRKLRLAGLGF